MQENIYEKFFEYLQTDDARFYEMFLKDLSDEELEEFLRKNPDFLKE